MVECLDEYNIKTRDSNQAEELLEDARCPLCNSYLEVDMTQLNAEVPLHLKCPNFNCKVSLDITFEVTIKEILY